MNKFIDQVLPAMTPEQLSKGLEQVNALGDIESQRLAIEDPIQQFVDNHLDPLWHQANQENKKLRFAQYGFGMRVNLF